MKIKIKDTAGITLKTRNTFVDQDIQVVPDTTNLEAKNIKKDVTILGVVGTCEEETAATVEGTTLVLGKASVSGTSLEL